MSYIPLPASRDKGVPVEGGPAKHGVFLCLSEYSNHVKDMMERVNFDSKLEKIPECKETLLLYLQDETIYYTLPHQNQTTLESNDGGSTLRDHWHAFFHTRIIRHNLRVVNIYFGGDGEAHFSDGIKRDTVCQDQLPEGRGVFCEEKMRGGGIDGLGSRYQAVVGVDGGGDYVFDS